MTKSNTFNARFDAGQVAWDGDIATPRKQSFGPADMSVSERITNSTDAFAAMREVDTTPVNYRRLMNERSAVRFGA